jgi:hypothetical protein
MRARNTAEFLSPLVYHAMCLRATRDAAFVAVEGVQVVQVADQHLADLLHRGRSELRAGERKCSISRKIHGRPWAARPIITASAPGVLEHELRLLRRGDVAVGDHRDPTDCFTARIVSYSASPVYMQARVRPCIASDWMP